MLIRRDPRDLSRVFVLDPLSDTYLEVPCRVLSRPAISLWEHRLACRRIRTLRREAVDETSLFAAVEAMRAIEREAMRLTRSARRDRTRRRPAQDGSVHETTPSVPPEQSDPVPRPFDDIEQW